MSLKEQLAYLKGLAEGLDVNTETKEGKIINAIINTLELIGNEIEDLIEDNIEIGEELDALSEDLADVEQFVFEEDEDENDFYDFDDDDFYDDEDDEEEYDDENDSPDTENNGCYCNLCNDTNLTFDVECPACGAEIELDETDLSSDGINCPKCSEHLEFEFEDNEDTEETETQPDDTGEAEVIHEQPHEESQNTSHDQYYV